MAVSLRLRLIDTGYLSEGKIRKLESLESDTPAGGHLHAKSSNNSL
jgi:hypothetical protein